MGKKPEVTLEWADGEYLFALRAAQVEELEAICVNHVNPEGVGVGISTIYSRVMNGGWYASDLYNIIRLSLIGGGTKPLEAKRLVEMYAKEVPLLGNYQKAEPDSPLTVAQAVLVSLMAGMPNNSGSGSDKGKK